jgi:ABC-type proline/glycine betaine transport system ATPase subunit
MYQTEILKKISDDYIEEFIGYLKRPQLFDFKDIELTQVFYKFRVKVWLHRYSYNIHLPSV